MQLAAGLETTDRMISTSSVGLVTGSMLVAYVVAPRTERVSLIAVQTAGTAAAGLTLCRLGVYGASLNGSGLLLASTVNDVALLAAAYTEYQKVLSVPLVVRAGEIYGLALLAVGTTMPTIRSSSVYAAAGTVRTSNIRPPVEAGEYSGQADLPTLLAVPPVAAVWKPYLVALP